MTTPPLPHSLLAGLCLLFALQLQAIVPEHTVQDGAVRLAGVGPDNPILYDNDWWFDVFDNNYLWAQASRGRSNLRGNIVSRDMWDWQKGYHYSFNQSWQDAEKALKFARDSNLKNIPGLTRGSDRVLLRPDSGHIEDTVAHPSEGSRLIVAEAKRASPQKPLLIIAGGPQTTVANALLTNPEIASNLVVFNLTVTGGYNGKDGWSAYIVAKRTRSVDWGGGQFWDKDSVFTSKDFEQLPDNPFTLDLKRFIKTDLGRANQLGDGAPLVWLFQPNCWTGAEVRSAEFQGTTMRYVPVPAGGTGDVLMIPKGATDLPACREEFFRVLRNPAVYQGNDAGGALTPQAGEETAALALASQATVAADSQTTCATSKQRVAAVVNTPGCVAFWDFVKREQNGAHRFTAHVPQGATNNFALDAGNYIRDFWSEGREATYADFPLLDRGPFGQAIRIRKEEDPTFRPFLFVPRERLHDSPIDIKGAGKSVSVVVWAIRESGNHALAGIWHEGTDLNHAGPAKVMARGQRQYALFAGLNKEGSACGHVSENGAKSFGHIYAMHKSNSGDISPAVPADSPAGVLDASWQCFATTFDHERHELTGWLNGRDTSRWQENVQKAIPVIHNAWVQGHLNREPGLQPGEDTTFPTDQFYNPPEETPVSVKVLSETADERLELHEFRYTRVKVTRRKAADGAWTTAARDLADVRLNPWWYPHDSLYTPANDGNGGPFTIGRVIHSSRSVGFTGWIGGVAVFNRALSAKELSTLSDISIQSPVAEAK